MPDLSGKTALVTGASQGVGRGIALVLAGDGAQVFATGRDTSRLEELEREAAARGGRLQAIVCDHGVGESVRILAEKLPELSILVSNAWGGYEANPNGLSMAPFWELPTSGWQDMFEHGLRMQFLCGRYLVPRMSGSGGALFVQTVAWADGKYLRNLYYDVVKHAAIRMTYGMNLELKPRGITALALAPGFVRTERVMAAHAAKPFDLSVTESPEYTGRAVAHLAVDPRLAARGGKVWTAGQLAREYGFLDSDGRQPAPFSMPPDFALD